MSDYNALKSLINAQKEKRATISENMLSHEYRWNEDGHLTEIFWSNKNLSGSIDFSAFPELTYIDCSGNDNLTEINISKCPNLKSDNVNVAEGVTVIGRP